MLSRWIAVTLVVAPGCGDMASIPPCGEKGLQPIEPAVTLEDVRYNDALASLQDQLHRAVGQYVDGTRPAYYGDGSVLEQRRSSVYGDREFTASGPLYAVLDDDRAPLDTPESTTSQDIRRIFLYFPADDFTAEFAEDARAPGVPIEGVGSDWTTCQGAVTPLLGAPDHITLSEIVCDRDGYESKFHFEFRGELDRLDPGEIDYARLLDLRAVGVVGYLPPLGEPDPETGVIVTVEDHGELNLNIKDGCHDEVQYRSVSFVRTDCLASHGVSELEIGEARRCCCLVYDCAYEYDYSCKPL